VGRSAKSAGKAVKASRKASDTPDVPDALTLDEVLEQLLPHCDDDPFEVAEWVDSRIKKKKGIRLLADGVFVRPHSYKTHLAMVAEIAPDGRATLEVALLGRAFGINNKPIKQWTMERKSLETNRPNAPRNRGGRPDKYPHMHIVSEALVYIAINGTPATLDGDGGLFEKLGLVLKPAETPERKTLYKIFNPIWKRIEDERERKRIEDERKKSKKKPNLIRPPESSN
jgi:hypothetical protein